MGRPLPKLDRGRYASTVSPPDEHGASFKQKHGAHGVYSFRSSGECCEGALTDAQRAYHFGGGDALDSEFSSIVGSNSFPAMVEVGPGVAVPLDSLVEKAHARSGLSVEKWNALDDDVRDAMIQGVADELKSTLVPVKEGPKTRFVGTREEKPVEKKTEKPMVEVKRPRGPAPSTDEEPAAAEMDLQAWVSGEVVINTQDVIAEVAKRYGAKHRTAAQLKAYLIKEQGFKE